MTIILLIITIIYLLIFLAYRSSIKTTTNVIQEDNAKVNSLLVESISSYETIKGLNIEALFRKKINKAYLSTISDNLFLNQYSHL